MQQMLWSSQHLKQCERKLGQAALSDERSLVLYAEDFGKLNHSNPFAIAAPQSAHSLQQLLQYANAHQLPLTIRGKGLSQGGQALAASGSLIVSMQNFTSVQEPDEEGIWVDANASWSDLLRVSLPQSRVPLVLPYNCDLSIAGVLSAGGVGASSFKYGSIVEHVAALEVVTADGEIQEIDCSSPLFHACLGGQGRFAVISKAKIKLRACCGKARSFFLLYLDKDTWLHDMQQLRNSADYMEFFCTPAIQGAKLSGKGRFPFAQWFFALHVTVEYENQAPELADLCSKLSPWKLLHTQDEKLDSYLHRHDGRFQSMKITGQWDLQHPWYECFIPEHLLFPDLEQLLASLPVYYATVVQIVPVAKIRSAGFFMLPESDAVYALMILNPGLPPALIPGCLETINRLDDIFLKQGCKRYLSGFLGYEIKEEYWQKHFNSQYDDWIELKQRYDPQGIFGSVLHRNKL